MKLVFKLLIIFIMTPSTFAQRNAWDKDNNKISYKKEDIELTFDGTKIEIPQKEGPESFALAATLIPSAVDLGFNLVTNSLERRQKKFSGEYFIQRSYLDAGKRNDKKKLTIPVMTFERKIQINNDFVTAIKIVIAANPIEGFDGYYYFVDSIELNYSKAMTTNNCKMFDFTIELKLTFFVDGEKKAQELHPITINSVGFGVTTFEPNYKHRSDIIPLPKDGMFLGLSMKIVETNPEVVQSEIILGMIQKYKDDTKTIINNVIEYIEKKDSNSEEEIDPNETDEKK